MDKTSVAIKWYRFEHWLWKHNMKCCAQIVYHMMQMLFGCTIPLQVVMDQGVNIAHFHGIVIHPDTVIKQGTMIYQNVILGGRNGETGILIGENCRIYAGACVLGNITIGNNVSVGANAVVLHDCPDNSTVVGVPGKIISKT